MNRIQHYFNLILYRSWADFRIESTRMYLGVFWWILEPLLDTLVYYIVFGVFFQNKDPYFVPFLITGLIIWRFFSSSFLGASHSIFQKIPLSRQVKVPKIIFPCMAVLTRLYNLMFSILLLLVVFAIYHIYPSVHWLGGIAVFGVITLFIMGIALPASAIIPFVPDLYLGINHLVRLWFFLSGVFYNIRSLPENLQGLIKLNPMATLISYARDCFMHQKYPDWNHLAIISIFSLVGIFIGVILIGYFEHKYGKRVPV